MANDSEDIADLDPCSDGRIWWIYLVLYFAIYLVGFSTSALFYLLRWFLERHNLIKCGNSRFLLYYKILCCRVRLLLSGDTIPSKIFISFTLLCNLIYMGLAIYRSFPPHNVEECFSLSGNLERIVELAVVLELISYSILRFLAANDILRYWFSLYTIVDVVTLPHIFIYLALGVDWIGFRSLRFVWLTQLVVVFQFIKSVSSRTIDGISIMIYFVILWFSASGIIHLLETQGDPWRGYENAVNHTVLVYVYYTMVTMSTVGYGDITPVTDLGRTFMTIFLIGGLAFFAAILPKSVEVISDYYSKMQYAKFDTTRVSRHVIVCGHITAVTAEDFIKDFLHPDRGDNHTLVLFLHSEKPDQDLRNVLYSYDHTRVQFLQGSVMNSKDLHKANILSSDAVFILANKHTDHSAREDSANLLRLVSIKNMTSKIRMTNKAEVRVIIQLLHSFSKKQVYNIEGWKVGRDIAVCLNELKLGLLAQSCLCPGFSTMIANLFYTSDFSSGTGEEEWKDNYIKGASNEIYSSTFSPDFNGMTFHEAAQICYNELNLVLLALGSYDMSCEQHTYYVNPSPKSHPQFRIRCDTMTTGYFIAKDQQHVSGVRTFTSKEACGVTTTSIVMELSSSSLAREEPTLSEVSKFRGDGKSLSEEPQYTALQANTTLHFDSDESPLDDSVIEGILHGIDLEGSKSEEAEEVSKPNKLEECILSPDAKPGMQPDIRNHVVLCIFADASSPLIDLGNFLKPLRRKNMLPEMIRQVVIVSNRAFIEKEWTVIHSIPKVYVVAGSPLRWENLRAARVMDCSVCVILSVLASTGGREHAIDDKEVILCSLSVQKKLKKKGKKGIHVITDLRQESNVQFLDFGDEDEPDERIYKAQPFACGEATSVSIFDSITTSAFYIPGIINLVESLIHASGTKSACKIVLKPISETRGTFGALYNEMLQEYDMCLGLSRKLPSSNQRYIITCPDSKLPLKEDDFVLVLTE